MPKPTTPQAHLQLDTAHTRRLNPAAVARLEQAVTGELADELVYRVAAVANRMADLLPEQERWLREALRADPRAVGFRVTLHRVRCWGGPGWSEIVRVSVFYLEAAMNAIASGERAPAIHCLAKAEARLGMKA